MRREWGKMFDMGFSTCVESFGSTRSVAHGWSTAPATYLPSRVLGVRPLTPGYGTFVVDPCPGDLEWARGAVVTPHGPISVTWRRNRKKELEITCTAPPECQRVV
jgi:alpha-L-rhamnosidase